MQDHSIDAIPAASREPARAALRAAFGQAPLVGARKLPSANVSGAAIYRIEIADRSYLLRLEPRGHDNGGGGGDGGADRRRAYRCMAIAAQAGIAPGLRHADAQAGVAIMDFLPSLPLEDFPGGPARRAQALGGLLARLQAAELFPPRLAYPTMLAAMFDRLQQSGLFAPGLLDVHRAGFERIRLTYGWNEATHVSSHGDPHRDNIVFDGARLWLIDWETAARNDPMVDAAILTNYLATTPELENALLLAWLGRVPDALLRARLLLMRQMIRIFYACAALNRYSATMTPGAEHLPVTDLSALSPRQFMAALADGRLVLGAAATHLAGGKVDLARFMAVLATRECQEALAIVTAG